MSRQYAQPLICDARNLTNSSSGVSIPDCRTYFSRSSMALTAPGAALAYSIRGCIFTSTRLDAPGMARVSSIRSLGEATNAKATHLDLDRAGGSGGVRGRPVAEPSNSRDPANPRGQTGPLRPRASHLEWKARPLGNLGS